MVFPNTLEITAMKLYYSPSACSLAPHIVLHEAGLPFEAVLASTKTHKLPDGSDFYAINPKGYVPALQMDNGQVLTEGAVIMQYVADLAPVKNLAPPNGTLPRYRLQEWLNFISTELHKGVGGLFNPAMPEEGKAVIRSKAMDRLKWMDSQLEGKSYVMGSDFSIADAYLFTVVNWTQFVGMDIASLKNLAAFQARMLTRPAVQAAMKAEGLLK
jgi:glutathione S-transferase